MICDIVAERAILSIIYQKSAIAYDEIADILDVNSFTDSLNQSIYKCFQEIFKRDSQAKLDYPTLISTANDLKLQVLNHPTSTQFIRSLENFPCDSDNINKLASRVKTLEIRRKLVNLHEDIRGQLIKADKSSGIDEILNISESPILDFSLHLNADTEIHSIGDGLYEWLKYKSENQTDKVGISTGLDLWDESIGGGLRRGTVNIIGGRAKSGKSGLAAYFSRKIGGLQNIPTLILDSEMNREVLWARLIASITQIKLRMIETGKFANDPELVRKVNSVRDKLAKAPIYYQNIAGKDVGQTISLMRRWIRKHVGFYENGRSKDCLIIYDYLKLTDSKEMKDMQEHQVLGFMMTGLHNFAMKYDIPIIAMVQLNRDGLEKENESVVSQSDRIIWLCSSFSIFKPKTEEEMAEDTQNGGNRKLITVISRYGAPMGNNYLNIQFDGDTMNISPAKTQREIYEQRRGFEMPEEIPFG